MESARALRDTALNDLDDYAETVERSSDKFKSSSDHPSVQGLNH